MSRIAVCSRSFSRHQVLRAELQERYPSVTFNADVLVLSGESLISFLKGHRKAIIGLERLGPEIFSALPELQVVSRFGVGLDKIDLGTMAKKGIKLGWTAGLNKRSVSELVIALALALLRHLPLAGRETEEGAWRKHVGRQIGSMTVGIVGCGHIGQDLAVLLKAFGCKVLAHDILDFPEFYQANGVEPASLEDLLGESDIVTLHLPLDDSTENILSAERLAMMKPGAVLINTARGGLVDEAALKELLQEKRLAGAAFDVFASEPPEDMELLALPNFLATPHIGGNSAEAVLAVGRAAIRGLDEGRVPEPGVFPPGAWNY